MVESILVDTDPGVDDTAALFWLFSVPEKVEIVGITTVFGNVEVEQATENATVLLAEGSREDLPVFMGCGSPLVGMPRYSKHVHGELGLGGFTSSKARQATVGETPGAMAILEQIERCGPDELTILALGPLTNLAVAYRMNPTLFRRLKRVIYMGGAAVTWGNAAPRASANIRNDPDAAAVVVDSGVPMVQIGLDVCRKFVVGEDDMERLKVGAGRLGEVLHAMVYGSGRPYDRPKERHPASGSGVYFNDGPCVGVLVYPELFDGADFHVSVERHGEHTKGETVVDIDGVLNLDPNVHVCLDVDGEKLSAAFVNDLCGSSAS